MQPFVVPYGETWTILRGAGDRTGDRDRSPAGTLTKCVYWQNVPVEPGGEYPANARESATLTSTLAVPKGSPEVRQSDVVRRESTGVRYQVLGPANWDGVHPQTGWNPGYLIYTLKAVTG
ncbi:hypothetical protein [Nocardia brasiliensis]|uniref:hypothetical protein n=1 Tax=Nocardia brasiliensis TaxID=37326 RepID=UPI002453DC3B|nr:hypothetical protein [Nocardia brasiliensis]